MTRSLKPMTLVLLLCAWGGMNLSACSDDDPQTTADAAKHLDAGGKADAQKVDGTAKDAAAQASANCQTVIDCVSACGINITCVAGCTARGCTSAQAAANALITCTQANCAVDCASGASTACESCTQEMCSSQVAACHSNTCGSVPQG